jgi:hypothetical protein
MAVGYQSGFHRTDVLRVANLVYEAMGYCSRLHILSAWT